MLDPVSLALPMVQAISGLGVQGSIQLSSQTGLSIDFSFQFNAPSGGSSSGGTGPTMPPAPSMDGIGNIVSSLKKVGGSLFDCGKALFSAIDSVANAWTGIAQMNATKHVSIIGKNAQELAKEHEKLAESTRDAAIIVTEAAADMANEIATFLRRAAEALTHPNPYTTPIELLGLAAAAVAKCANIFLKAHADLQGPTSRALETIQGSAKASLDINGKPLPLPKAGDIAKLVKGGASLAGAIFDKPSFDMGVQVRNGALTGAHVAWGEDVDKIHPDPSASTRAASAGNGTLTSSNSANIINGAKSPTGMTPTNTPSTGAGATAPITQTTYDGPTGGGVASNQIGAGNAGRTSTYSNGTSGYVTQGTPAATGVATNTVSPAGTSAGVGYAQAHSTAAPINGSIGSATDQDGYYDDMISGELDITLPDGTVTHAPNEVAARAIRAALTQLGVPYVWGGTTPGVGLDCSGLTQWSYEQAGLEIGRTTWDQDNNPQVDPTMALPGDLIMWDGHVAMFLGNGMMIEAGDPVSITPVRTENAGMAFEGVFRPWAGVA